MQKTLGSTLTTEQKHEQAPAPIAPPGPVFKPDDCPEYGEEFLPGLWQCQPGCPLFDECLEASQQANGGSNGKT